MLAILKGQASARPVVTTAYLGAVVASGLVAGFAALRFAPPTEHVWSVALLVGLAGLSQFASVSLFGQTSVSLSFAFTFLCLVWFGPGAATLTVVVATLVHAVYPARRPWKKVLFNFGSLSLAVAAGGIVYTAAGGTVAPESMRTVLFPALVAGAVYFLVNTLTVSGAMSLTSKQRFLKVWASNHYGLWAYYLSVVILAVVAATTFHIDEYIAYPGITALLALPWVITRLWVMRAKQLAQAIRHGGQLRLLHRVGLNVNRAGLNTSGAERMEEVLKPVLTAARELVSARASAIVLRDGGEGDFRLAAQSGLEVRIGQALEIALGKDDLASLERGEPLTKPEAPPAAAKGAATTGGAISAMYFPLIAEGRTLGAMGLFFNGRPNLSEEDLAMLKTLAEYAAGAENRLHKTEELEKSHHRVMMAQESVRKEVSATLHGTVQNRLLLIWLRLEKLASDQKSNGGDRDLATELRAELMTIQGDLRSLSTRLHPSIVKVGLRPALRSLANRFAEAVPVEVDVQPAVEQLEADGMVPAELRLTVYRVAEEALTNVVKHAHATQASLRTWVEGRSLKLSVEDNGKGFTAGASGGGLGIEIMKDYARGAGGAIEVRSTPARGTIVAMSLPLPASAAGLAALDETAPDVTAAAAGEPAKTA
jgi:signal transduction histidine kinase